MGGSEDAGSDGRPGTRLRSVACTARQWLVPLADRSIPSVPKRGRMPNQGSPRMWQSTTVTSWSL